MKKSEKNLGELIKTWRERKRFTQTHLANKLGVSISTIQNWESGSMVPHPRNFNKFLEMLKLSEREFYNGPAEIEFSESTNENILDKMLSVYPFSVTHLERELWPEIGYSLTWSNQFDPKDHYLVYVDMNTQIVENSFRAPFGSTLIIEKTTTDLTVREKGIVMKSLDYSSYYHIQNRLERVAFFKRMGAVGKLLEEDHIFLGRVIKIVPRIAGMETMQL